MLTKEENDLLTQTDPGTPCGDLMRRYWQPTALCAELPPGGPPRPVRLLGEDLVLYRDDQGRPGLLGLHCSHRGADLTYGRVEDGGLRCIYHGWLYDLHGRCLEQPGEPVGSTFHEKIHHVAYPCLERAGIIFAYLGPGEPPLLPQYEFLMAADESRFTTKVLHNCNYLQANEGNYDPVHHSFLHLRLRREGTKLRRGAVNYSALDRAPVVEADETDFGARVYGVRRVGADMNYVTIRNFVLPGITLTATAGAHWHVPIDDTRHWKYVILFNRAGRLDPAVIGQTRAEIQADYCLVRNQANRYLQDREEMKNLTYSGLGTDNLDDDLYATEGEGPIQDRTQEHLGYGDQGIIVARKVLLRAIREVHNGREAPHVIRDATANHFPELVSMHAVIPASVDWRTSWRTNFHSHEHATAGT